MRLHSVRVQNYRVHGDREVELDPARTLIGGPNESGKSTLMEAAHRALFLKAKVTGELQKSMVSRAHQGHPQVEVQFEADGKIYTIEKRFSGVSGTATLSEKGGDAWHGDEAESRLAEILKIDGTIGGPGAAGRLASQWAHLWVWQGRAGGDPSEDASRERDSLLARLKKEGGAAAMQSELDSSVARQFFDFDDQLFTKAGHPKAQSELARAIDDLEEAETGRHEALEKVERLEQAAADFRNAERTLCEKQKEIDEFETQRKETEKKLEEARKLGHDEKLRKLAAERVAEEDENLVTADREIRELQRSIEENQKALDPKEAETRRLEAVVEAGKKRLKSAEKIYGKLEQELRSARNGRDLSKAWADLFECEQKFTELGRRAGEIVELKKKLSGIEKERARLPEVSEVGLEALRDEVRTLDRAEAALKAMAAGIEIVTSKVEVRIGGEILPADAHRIIFEDTEIEVGDAAALKITPGGGTSLGDARDRVADSEKRLRESLDKFGVASLDEATTVYAERRQLGTDIDSIVGQLEGKDAGTIDERLGEAAIRVEAARAEVERRRTKLETFTDPKDAAAARALVTEAEDTLGDLESRESPARADRDAASAACEKAGGELDRHRQAIERAREALTESKAKLSLHEDTHGEAPQREKKLRELSRARKEAEAQLGEIRTALKKLQPEALEADRERFDRALREAQEVRQAADNTRAVSKSVLTSDGAFDPGENLAKANARLESAAERHRSVETRARAIRLLSKLFAEEQQALADQFTQPLAEKISGYLQQLFGSETSVGVTLEDGEFAGLSLTRPGGTFEFDSLSGGAREQLAAAVRLAMAEILAEEHDGCLPILFDDAFANSDPERVQTLQRMLDLAARRRLQIIILTCDPSEYAGLGAKTVMLGAASPAAEGSEIPEPAD